MTELKSKNPESKTFEVWITKYALTQGIYKIMVEASIEETMVVQKKTGRMALNHYFHKPYWHLTREAAIEQAEAMRLKKLKTLKLQTMKFERMTFR